MYPGADEVLFGYLQTTFAVAQFVGGPLMGMAMDAKGYRWALCISQVYLSAKCVICTNS